MSTQKILIAGVAGGVVFFLLGWLLYGILFMNFFEGQMGSASGVNKDPMDYWALIVGNIAWGILLAVIFGRWAGIKTLATGATAGAVIGLLAGISWDFTMYGTTNLSTMTGVIVDILIVTVMSAVTGAVVGMVLGRDGK